MNHQQRKPTRPPTTITATDMPAMAPVLRLGLLLPAVPSLTRWQRTTECDGRASHRVHRPIYVLAVRAAQPPGDAPGHAEVLSSAC